MKKLLLIVAFLFLFAPLSPALDYYAKAACASGNMSTCGWNTTANASCNATGGTDLVWANRAAGDILHANGCTGIIVDTDPGLGTGQNLTLSTAGGTASGGFTCATATGPAIINADISAGGSAVLAISGSTAGNPAKCSIAGNLTGGTGTNFYAVTDSHTVGTIVVTGNLTGGSGASPAYNANSTGPVIINGNATGGAASANGILGAAAGSTVTINGDCIASDTAIVPGCKTNATAAGGGSMTITGSIIASTKEVGATGRFFWVPSATTKCIILPKTSSYTVQSSCAASDANITQAVPVPASGTSGIVVGNVKTGETYGGYTGTMAAGQHASPVAF